MSSGTPLSRAAGAIARSQIGARRCGAAQTRRSREIPPAASARRCEAPPLAAGSTRARAVGLRGRRGAALVAEAWADLVSCVDAGGGLALDDEVVQRLARRSRGGRRSARGRPRSRSSVCGLATRDGDRELAAGEPQLQRHLRRDRRDRARSASSLTACAAFGGAAVSPAAGPGLPASARRGSRLIGDERGQLLERQP